MDVQTEYGVARTQHLAAARRIFDSMVQRSIERQVLIQRATRIEALSPPAGMLLRKWMQMWNKSCEGLTASEVPDTDDGF